MKIHKHEIKKPFVEKYLSKGANSTNEDSIYFYYNRAMLIAQEMNYPQGEIKACKGLVKLYENDEEIYEKLRYSLLLVGLYTARYE